jgi:hypothetical protein
MGAGEPGRSGASTGCMAENRLFLEREGDILNIGIVFYISAFLFAVYYFFVGKRPVHLLNIIVLDIIAAAFYLIFFFFFLRNMEFISSRNSLPWRPFVFYGLLFSTITNFLVTFKSTKNIHGIADFSINYQHIIISAILCFVFIVVFIVGAEILYGIR